MSDLTWLAAALFLPLFPFSMLLNQVMPRIRRPWQRIVLLLAWPQVGIALVTVANGTVPTWVAAWAVATAALYGFRAIVVRDLGLWIQFIGTSTWALLWLLAVFASDTELLPMHALASSLPLVILTLVGVGLERRFGAAYAGVSRGLAQASPRLAAVFVVSVLVAVATPPAPGFFTLLAAIIYAMPAAPVVAGVVTVTWLFWAWSAARLVQGFIVGTVETRPQSDIGPAQAWLFGLFVAALSAQGLLLFGKMP